MESEFRPHVFRITEYLFFLWCVIFNRKRLQKLSLGPCQVQYRFWIEFIDYNKSSLEISCLFEDPKTNYHLVEWYIKKFNVHNLFELSEIYTGKKNRYYVKKILEALEFLKDEQPKNRHHLT